nr:hypothetical protein [Tanacetum cinerariifolium]
DEKPTKVDSQRVIVYGYDGITIHPTAPPSPNYMPGPEHPPSLDYVPSYVADSDPDKDLEDPEEDHNDYPSDGGDGDDDPSDDDDDDDDDTDDEEASEDEDDDEEEEEEHLVPADPSAIHIVEPVLSAGDTEAFVTDETDIPEAKMPPRKRACFTTLALGLKVRESSAAGVAR